MQTKLYAIKDSKSNSYGPPMCFGTRGLFLRFISEELQRGQCVWAKHPQDFNMFEVGDYDVDSGSIQIYETKESLGLISDLKGLTN